MFGDEPINLSSFSDRTEYAPVGFCIYCGSTENLTDEHTLASGLGGRHVLPDSSCETCRNTISAPEQYVQRTLVHNARAYYGIKSHRRRPRLPTTVTVRKKSGEVVEITGDPREIPLVIVLPVFPAPMILTNDDPPPKGFMAGNWNPKPTHLAAFLAKHDAECIVSKAIRPLALARVIAKTAHAHATALLGAGSFKPLLGDLILGKTDRWINLVGGEVDDEGKWKLLRPTPKHLNTFTIFDYFRDTDGKCFYVAAVRLFSNLGAPTYFAVLGEPIPPRPPWRIKPDVAKRLGPPHTIFVPRVAALPKKLP